MPWRPGPKARGFPTQRSQVTGIGLVSLRPRYGAALPHAVRKDPPLLGRDLILARFLPWNGYALEPHLPEFPVDRRQADRLACGSEEQRVQLFSALDQVSLSEVTKGFPIR